MGVQQNILNNSTRALDARLFNDEYFDFMLYRGESNSSCDNLSEQLIADFSDLIIEDGKLYSSVLWKDAVNNGVDMKDIGFTGYDNGLLRFIPGTMSPQELMILMTQSRYQIQSGDTRFFLSPINGSTGRFKYDVEYDDEEKYLTFKGGFLQGFYKLEGFDYQVLPNNIDNELNFSFMIRPQSSFPVEENTLNYLHPENNGIFFYIGTRAENKFAKLYNPDDYPDDSACTTYLKDFESCDCVSDLYGLKYENNEQQPCNENGKIFPCDFVQKNKDIDYDTNEDSDGHKLSKKGYFEIDTDNKFILFNRTDTGFTTENWVDGATVTLTGRTDWNNINYFPLMNRTETGYTVNDIYEYNEENTIPYNIYSDIKNNSFALKITDDGRIGYRYGVVDCSVENHFSIEEEYSKAGLIKDGEWNNIFVKFVILNPSKRVVMPSGKMCYDPKKYKRKMKIMIFVNGFLKLISKELPEFNFRCLNDVYQKQEAVPFSISLGGGTQGLLESIFPDYKNFGDIILPLEKNFCGTFLGDIKSFKIYENHVNYSCVSNYLY